MFLKLSAGNMETKLGSEYADYRKNGCIRGRVLSNVLDTWATGGSVVVDSLLIVTPIAGFCNCSMFCYVLLYVLECNHLDGEERAGCFS